MINRYKVKILLAANFNINNASNDEVMNNNWNDVILNSVKNIHDRETHIDLRLLIFEKSCVLEVRC